jgi:hypothetical protein
MFDAKSSCQGMDICRWLDPHRLEAIMHVPVIYKVSTVKRELKHVVHNPCLHKQYFNG